MKTIKVFLLEWVDAVVANNGLSQNASVTLLQQSANVTDAEGAAFFDAVADYFGQLGLTNGNYGQLRNFARDNGDAAKKLFNSIVPALRELPAVPPIGKAIRQAEFTRERDEINEDIAAVKIFRDAFTSADRTEQRAVKRALKVGLDALRKERDELQRRRTNMRPQR